MRDLLTPVSGARSAQMMSPLHTAPLECPSPLFAATQAFDPLLPPPMTIVSKNRQTETSTSRSLMVKRVFKDPTADEDLLTFIKRPKRRSSSKPGSICHQCKYFKELQYLNRCTAQIEASDSKNKHLHCGNMYCTQCLSSSYREMTGSESKWTCPACRGICSCTECYSSYDTSVDEEWIAQNPRIRPLSPATSVACGIVYFGDFSLDSGECE